jgi:hypothetical protein
MNLLNKEEFIEILRKLNDRIETDILKDKKETNETINSVQFEDPCRKHTKPSHHQSSALY